MTMIMIPTMIPAKYEFNPGAAVAAASDYVVVAIIVAADTDVVVVAAMTVPLLVDLMIIKKVLLERKIKLRHRL